MTDRRDRRLRRVLDALLDDELIDHDSWSALVDDLDRLLQTSGGGPVGAPCPTCGTRLVLHRPTSRLVPAPTTTEENDPECD